MINLINDDCLSAMKEIKDNSVDSIVTDPPYGLSFMGKKWDYDVPSVEIWQEAMRVLKPGGHLLSFAGSRTYHRMAVNIEDAGFEIRDQIMWVYGSGFPKSHNIGKAVDKLQGNERESIGVTPAGKGIKSGGGNYVGRTEYAEEHDITKGTSEWEGWGTALKPAHEPIVVARKPFKGTVANNVLEWGTGGINIDGCRVGLNGEKPPTGSGNPVQGVDPKAIQPGRSGGNGGNETNPHGRFPANFIHDGSDEVVELFPETAPSRKGGKGKPIPRADNKAEETISERGGYNDLGGSASRFFYCPKASKKDRNEGLPNGQTSTHPTVKPTKLMQYLVRLVTPKEGTVLDPFMGSGSTGKACVKEGFDFIGIEMDEEYCKIAQARIGDN